MYDSSKMSLEIKKAHTSHHIISQFTHKSQRTELYGQAKIHEYAVYIVNIMETRCFAAMEKYTRSSPHGGSYCIEGNRQWRILLTIAPALRRDVGIATPHYTPHYW